MQWPVLALVLSYSSSAFSILFPFFVLPLFLLLCFSPVPPLHTALTRSGSVRCKMEWDEALINMQATSVSRQIKCTNVMEMRMEKEDPFAYWVMRREKTAHSCFTSLFKNSERVDIFRTFKNAASYWSWLQFPRLGEGEMIAETDSVNMGRLLTCFGGLRLMSAQILRWEASHLGA